MAFPRAIFSLQFLTDLTIFGCSLSKLPNGIGELTSLRTLELQGNSIKIIPSSIGKCVKLRTIHVEANRLVRLPPEIAKLPALHYVFAEGNRELGNFSRTMSIYDKSFQQQIAYRYARRGAREAAKTLLMIKKFTRGSIWDRVPLDLVRYVFPPLLIATETDEEWHDADDAAYRKLCNEERAV